MTESLIRDWQQVSPIGVDKLDFSISPDMLGIREAFGEDIKAILEEQGKIKRAGSNRGVEGYNQFIQTSNGNIIINPEIEITNGRIILRKSQIGKYETYHALNNLRLRERKNKSNSSLEKYRYEVLSAGGIFYDPEKESFFLYKRPSDSQEAAGEIDLLGGCMNTSDGINEEGMIDPAMYTASRLSTKGGISVKPEALQFMGIQKFKERGFYNLVYLSVLDSGISDKLNSEKVSEIPLSEVEKYMNQDNPGGAGLSLILSHPMFIDAGYGPEIMRDKIK